MAQTPSTWADYVGDGVEDTFQVTFPYQKQQEVFVTVDGAPADFTFISVGWVQLATVPASGAAIRVQRSTEAFTPRHEFENGVPLLPRFIDENNKQFLYVAQEAVNETAGTAAAALALAERTAELVGDTGFVSLGNYASGIEFTRYNEYMARGGLFYRPAPSSIPFTTTGTWVGADEGLFVLFSQDDVLRQDLADPDKGAALVGVHGEGTLQKWIDRNHGLTASQLGLVGGNDYTALFNGTLKDRVVSEDITEIILDTGDITVSGTLDYAYNRVTFSGEGEIVGTSLDNALQRMPAEKTSDKTYPSVITAGLFRNERSYNAIHREREIRVVLLGDSISVGSDYDSAATPPPGEQSTSGVDNLAVDNALSKLMFNELCSMVPTGTRVRFYTRAIAGLSYSELDQPWDVLSPGLWTGREGAAPGKTWRDCVLDLDPDLVIHSMGMNHTPANFLSAFSSKWYDYVQSKYLGNTFDQVILTTPNPNFETADQFGDFRSYSNNASKFYVASLQRFAARHHEGYSLVDVASLSYIKRYGFDPRSCSMEKDAHPLDGAVLSRYQTQTAAHPKMPFYHTTEFTLNPSVSSDQAGADYSLEVGSIIVQFAFGKLTIYPNRSSVSEGVVDYSFVLQAGTNTDVKVAVLPSGIFVYINGRQVLYNKNTMFYDSVSNPEFKNQSSVESTLTVSNARVFAQQFPRYAVDTRNDEMFGKLDWTTNKYGGGINHPSSVGLVEIYLPPVREYFSKLLNEPSRASSLQAPGIDNLIYVGTMSRKVYSEAVLRDVQSGAYISLRRSSGGAITVDNRSANTVQVTPQGAVYVAVTSAQGFFNLVWEGAWLNASPAYYPAGASASIGVATPPNTSLAITTTVGGLTTVVGQYETPAGEAESIITPSLPSGARVQYAAGTIAVNSPTVATGLYPIDNMNVYATTDGVAFRVQYDTAHPTNALGRRVMYEYRYTVIS